MNTLNIVFNVFFFRSKNWLLMVAFDCGILFMVASVFLGGRGEFLAEIFG